MKKVIFIAFVLSVQSIVNNVHAQKTDTISNNTNQDINNNVAKKAVNSHPTRPGTIHGNIKLTLAKVRDSVVQDKCKDYYTFNYKLILHNNFDAPVRFVIHTQTSIDAKTQELTTGIRLTDTTILLEANSSRQIKTSVKVNYPYLLINGKFEKEKQYIKAPVNVAVNAIAQYGGDGATVLDDTNESDNSGILNSTSPLPLPCVIMKGSNNTH